MDLNYAKLLPNELLIEIFDHLSSNMLIMCTLVCKRWNEVISTSGLISNRFRLKLEGVELNNYGWMQVERNYTSVHFKINQPGEDFFNVINPSIIQTLDLKCNIKSTHLTTFLSNLPALEELTMCLIIEEIPDNLRKIKLNIKKLNISNNLLEVLSHICANELVELFVEARSKKFVDFSNLIEFIGHQKKLEKLSVMHDVAEQFLNYAEVFKFEFRLKSFALCGESIPERFEDQLSRFLLIHRDTLDTVRLDEIQFLWRFNIYELIWNNMPHIKHIDMNIMDINLLLIEDNDPKWNQHIPIESITFVGDAEKEDLICLKTVLKKFPRTKFINFSCYFEGYDDTTTYLINSDMNNLTVLHMPRVFDQKLLSNHRFFFPNLREFGMSLIEDKKMARFFRRHAKTLKIISIECINDGECNVLEEILRIKYIKLSLRMNSLSAMKMYDARMLDPISWSHLSWTLEIKVGTWRYSYKFPDDEVIWLNHKQSSRIAANLFLDNLNSCPVFTRFY
jgi:hypothetical protein